MYNVNVFIRSTHQGNKEHGGVATMLLYEYWDRDWNIRMKEHHFTASTIFIGDSFLVVDTLAPLGQQPSNP